jgi:hypothetical protein
MVGYQVTNSMVRPVFEVVRYITKHIRHAFYTQNFHLISFSGKENEITPVILTDVQKTYASKK